MSLRSMTGHGRGSVTDKGLTITVEVHSVNRKQFDLVCTLPRVLQRLEARIAEKVSAVATRGRVTVDVKMLSNGGANGQRVVVDRELAGAYVKALRDVATEFDLRPDIRVDTLLALPDLWRVDRPQEDIEKAWSVLEPALAKALKSFSAMRTNEGQALKKDLLARLQSLAATLQFIHKRAPVVLKHYRATLAQRLQEAGMDGSASEERLAREVVLFADRSDITEELTRLASHLKQARAMTRSKEATGRSLDFLAQEMFREINTIGSKANDAQLLQHVVAFKTELERIREQVQNIE